MHPLPAFDAFLFDFGGVLIEIDFRRAFAAWATAAGTSAESVAARFRFDDAYAAHERGEIAAPDYFEFLRRSLGIDISDDQFLAGWNAIFVDEVAGMRNVLAEAGKTRPLYLFSNTCEVHKRYWLRQHRDLLRPFSKVFLSSEIGLRKPDPEAFLFVARSIGLPPERIAFFDDAEENVAGARKAGLAAFRVASPAEVLAALSVSP